jgi:phage N-6-adenine-methyltransferase
MHIMQDLADQNRADHARLTGLSKTADDAHTTLKDAARRAVDTAIDIGERLLTAQERLGVDFPDWVKDTHPFGVKQCEKYMRIAAHKSLARDAVRDGRWPGIDALVQTLPRRDEKLPPAPVDARKLAYTGSAVTPRAATSAPADEAEPDDTSRSRPLRTSPENIPQHAPRDADDWHTPSTYVESARQVMGSIDFDPFSSVLANRTVKATRFFTEADDALTAPWSATNQRTCWMNPPYSRGMSSQAVDRFLDQYDYGAFDQAVVLMNASTDTNWFHRLAKACSAFCLTNFRIAFDNTDGKAKSNNTKGQVFFYFGADPTTFKRIFAPYGIVLDTKGMTHG